MMPQWLPSDPDKGRPTKQKKKTKSRLGDFSGRLNSTSSNEMYMQINLQDLEAYTNQILEAERAKRRSVLCRVGVVLLWVGLVVTGGYTWKNQGGLLSNNNNATTTDKELFVDWITDETYQEYPLTTCERKLGHNTSFHDLVKHFRVNSDMAKQWHCRPEVSQQIIIYRRGGWYFYLSKMMLTSRLAHYFASSPTAIGSTQQSQNLERATTRPREMHGPMPLFKTKNSFHPQKRTRKSTTWSW